MIVSEEKEMQKLDEKDLENVNGGLIVDRPLGEKQWIIDDETGQCIGEEYSL